MVAGTFNNWRTDLFLYQWEDGQFYAVVDVPVGAHEYKYCIQAKDEYHKDVWVHDPEKPAVRNEFGTYNNVVRVDEKHVKAFRSINLERMIPGSGKGLEAGPDGKPVCQPDAPENPVNPSKDPEASSSPPKNPYNLPALHHKLRRILDHKYKSVSSVNPMYDDDPTQVRWEHCFGAVSDDMAVLVTNHSVYHKHSVTILCEEAKGKPVYASESDED